MTDGQTVALDRGVFTISLDFELIWGTLDLFGPERFRQACEQERAVVRRLLDLFAAYRVSATWCVLGHLFLDSCRPVGGRKHPELVRPDHAWCRQDWFHHDPCGDEESEPLYYGRTLVERIRACPVPQEIGSHSFSHVIFGDPGCSPAVADSEVRACVRLAHEAGIELRSFAFPRDSVGHLDVLRAHGFRCYRGPEPLWYGDKPWPVLWKRFLRLLDVLRAASPPVVLPEQTEAGLWNLPGSMIYFPMHGLRRLIPVGLRVRRAVKGLEAAAREKRLFHLWFHPTNLADRPGPMFAGLERILQHARRLCDRGDLSILTMAELGSAAARAAESRAGVGPRYAAAEGIALPSPGVRSEQR
jgi:peptidoglycan/xylan/chitin deacetylase (PgdA/CDA1 family)